MMWLITAALAINAVAIFALIGHASNLVSRLTDALLVSHEVCKEQTSQLVSDSYAAAVLQLAADDLDSVEGQARMRTLAMGYSDDGPSVPAMWLYDRAEHLLGDDNATTIHP